MSATLSEIASEAYGQFERAERPDGESFTRLKEGAPEWLHDLVREAHGDFLPDDFRYEWIHSAIGHVDDSGADDPSELEDADHEFADQAVDVYTGERLRWLASNLQRPAYCDEAVSEGLAEPDADMVARAGLGQFMEAREVFASVVESLTERFEEVNDDA